MVSAMEFLLEAENCLTAAQAAVDPDERAEFLRRSACYRNLALDVMRRDRATEPAFTFGDCCDPCGAHKQTG
jgi:hypothetical protein